MDQEGNIISPLGWFKLVPSPRPVSTSSAVSSSPSTTAAPSMSSTSHSTTTVTTAARSTTMFSTCPAVPVLAVPQPLAAPRAAVPTTTTGCTMMVPTAVPTPAKQILRVLDFRSSAKIPAHGLPPCYTGGVLPPLIQQDTETEQIKKNDSAMLDLQTALEEKDITIARLESDLATTTHNWEGQIDQLMWLNSVVQEKEVELFDKDLTISALESTASDQANTINSLSHDYEQMQARFIAIYNHCKNLAKDRQQKVDYIALLISSEEKAKQITVQQQNLTKSLLALKQKEKMSKFIDGNHSFYYGQTEPSPEVQQEMALAAARIRKEKEECERAEHAKLSDAVDRLARKYDRYNMITTTNIHNTRCDPDGLPCIVPRDMMGLWLFADMDLEPTEEERAMYEFHIQKEVRGPPIYSPNLPRPTVNWMTLNKHKRKNLPDPEIFPVHSVPADPNFYLDTKRYKPAALHESFDTSGMGLPVRMSKEACGCAACVPPFGRMYGLMTDMGVIAMPDTSVHGYKWDDFAADWVIATGG